MSLRCRDIHAKPSRVPGFQAQANPLKTSFNCLPDAAPASRDTGLQRRPVAPGSFAAPTVLVSSAIVVRLVDQKNLVASNGSSVELLMPKADTATVLDAIANGAVLSVLPVDLPLGQ